jgi:hypothetical protein
MDYENMNRKELQILAKKEGIKANQTTLNLIAQLKGDEAKQYKNNNNTTKKKSLPKKSSSKKSSSKKSSSKKSSIQNPKNQKLKITLEPTVDVTFNHTKENMDEFVKWFIMMLPQLIERGYPVNNNIKVNVLTKNSIKIVLEIMDHHLDEAEFIASEIKDNLDDGNNPIGVKNRNIEFIKRENRKTYSGEKYLVRFNNFSFTII